MAKKTLGESVHGKLPASTVLAAPWPYLLAGILILAIAAWARVGTPGVGTFGACQGHVALRNASDAAQADRCVAHRQRLHQISLAVS